MWGGNVGVFVGASVGDTVGMSVNDGRAVGVALEGEDVGPFVGNERPASQALQIEGHTTLSPSEHF
jgi:hypothetical protein